MAVGLVLVVLGDGVIDPLDAGEQSLAAAQVVEGGIGGGGHGSECSGRASPGRSVRPKVLDQFQSHLPMGKRRHVVCLSPA